MTLSAGDPPSRGARSYSSIDKRKLSKIEAGLIETSTHVEQMAANMETLMKALFPQIPIETQLTHLRFLERMRRAGTILWRALGDDVISLGPTWSSDLARGWAAFAVSEIPNLTMRERLNLLAPFAVDHHFAVREWAWLSFRRDVVAGPKQAIEELEDWTQNQDHLVRRFAIEATRPRSVWGNHITLLKEMPNLGEPLLKPLRCDDSNYVQTAVGNWLNDAATTRPGWVSAFIRSWHCECPNTLRITRRATRKIR